MTPENRVLLRQQESPQNQMVTGQGYPLEKGTGELLRSFVPY